MLKQRLTLNQGPKQSGRTRLQTLDVAIETMIGLDVRTCCSPYSLSLPPKGDAVAQPWCYITAVTVHGPIHRLWVSFAWSQSLCNSESAFHRNHVPMFHSGPGRGATDPSVLVLLWSESPLLMAILQVVADVLLLAKGFVLVSNEVM